MRGRGFEGAVRVGVAARLVRPPADLPRRTFRVMPGRKLLVHLAERFVRLLVVVVEDVMRRAVVERFLGPALRRELVHQAPDDAEVLVATAELARGDGEE